MAVKVVYKHWKSGMHLEVIGTMPKELNHEKSDRFVIKKHDGHFEDVLKSTVIRVTEWSPR